MGHLIFNFCGLMVAHVFRKIQSDKAEELFCKIITVGLIPRVVNISENVY